MVNADIKALEAFYDIVPSNKQESFLNHAFHFIFLANPDDSISHDLEKKTIFFDNKNPKIDLPVLLSDVFDHFDKWKKIGIKSVFTKITDEVKNSIIENQKIFWSKLFDLYSKQYELEGDICDLVSIVQIFIQSSKNIKVEETIIKKAFQEMQDKNPESFDEKCEEFFSQIIERSVTLSNPVSQLDACEDNIHEKQNTDNITEEVNDAALNQDMPSMDNIEDNHL